MNERFVKNSNESKGLTKLSSTSVTTTYTKKFGSILYDKIELKLQFSK